MGTKRASKDRDATRARVLALLHNVALLACLYLSTSAYLRAGSTPSTGLAGRGGSGGALAQPAGAGGRALGADAAGERVENRSLVAQSTTASTRGAGGGGAAEIGGAAVGALAAAGAPPSHLPLGAWAVHTPLGLLWNVTHFGRRDLPGSVKVMAGVWASSLATAAAWWRADPAAGKFFAPTCVWLTVAAALNVSIARLNRKKGE